MTDQVFSYYGAKSKIINYYPPPKYDWIVEPFAGSAAYSQKYWQRNVILTDLDPIIVETWSWLISATPDDVARLPLLDVGDDVRSLDIPQGARNIIRFWLGTGSAKPEEHQTLTRARASKNWYGWNARKRDYIAAVVPRFKHWRVAHASYLDWGDFETTWFVDPPYCHGGERYRCPSTSLDFARLAEWCRARNGQVIVCENTKADWLPFRPLVDIRGSRHKTTEAIWP